MNLSLVLLLLLLLVVGSMLVLMYRRLLRHQQRTIKALFDLLDRVRDRHQLLGELRDSLATFESTSDTGPTELGKQLLSAVGKRDRVELEPLVSDLLSDLALQEQLLTEQFDRRVEQDSASNALTDRTVDLLGQRKTLDNQVAFSIQRYNEAVKRYFEVRRSTPMRYIAEVTGFNELLPFQVPPADVVVSSQVSFA